SCGDQNWRATPGGKARPGLVPGWRTDQGFNLAGKRRVRHRAIERAATLALDDRRQVGRALATPLANEYDIDAMSARHIAMNALDALDRARRVGVAQDERGALHRDAIDQEPERDVDDLVAARA